MIGNKSEKAQKVKIYIVIGLSVVLLISAYFRFIHARIKTNRKTDNVSGTDLTSLIQLPPSAKLPGPKTAEQKGKAPAKSKKTKLLQAVVRDIFEDPLDLLPKKTPLVEEEPQLPPAMELKGTIVGGEKPIAIINEQFVRLGDSVGDYRVTEIDKDKVVLRSGKREIVLDVLSHVHN